MKPLVVIPARGGSKELPNKNIRILGGKPLIQYTIEAAQKVFKSKEICVSTDYLSIKEISEELGLLVPFLRPYKLATDAATTYNVLLHALDFYERNGYQPDTIVLLQPTSPFRNSNHIKMAMSLYNEECEMVVSVTKTKSNPYYKLMEEDNNGWLIKSKKGNYSRRQDCPEVWEYNGAIYIINASILKQKPLYKFEKIRKFIMDEFSSIDIDNEIDLQIANCLMGMINSPI